MSHLATRMRTLVLSMKQEEEHTQTLSHTHTHLACLSRCVFISEQCHVSNAPVSPEASRKEAKAAAFLMRSSFKRSIQTSESREADQREETGIKTNTPEGSRRHTPHTARGEAQPSIINHGLVSRGRMWTWRSFLCVSLVSGLALDSNTIRSSKETLQPSSELPVGPSLRLRTAVVTQTVASLADTD